MDSSKTFGSDLSRCRRLPLPASPPKSQQSLNARQVKVLNRLLDGFEGKLTTSKYAKLTKSSQDTAYRHILELVERGALRKDPGGWRSTSYSVVTGVERK